MASFDIVSKVDIQKLDNAINTVRKEIVNRYDFNNSKTSIDLDKKEMTLHVVTEQDMRMQTIQDIIITRMVKQGLDTSCLDFGKELYASGNMVKKDIKIKTGVDKETGKKIVKLIKDTGMKVQASIMDDQVRVTGKKLDDLQEVIAMLKKHDLEIPLQYENFRN
ncbi:MAG: YajQ family cyclic di-GMP-binding protein [Bacteroidota bacterium]